MPPVTRPTENVRLLEEHADAIRALRKRTVDNIVEIGKRLILAQALAGRGNWLAWLKDEFGWGDQTARNFMNVARQSQNFLNVNLPISSLYQLAAPSTPPAARNAIVKKAAKAKVTHREVVETVRAAKPVTKPRLVSTAEPPTYQIQHTEPVDAPFDWRLFVSRAESNAHVLIKRWEEEWRGAIERNSQMPSELRVRLLDCLKSHADDVNDMIATFEAPTTH